MTNLVWIDPRDDLTPFPEVGTALRDPDGLLAIGGNLSVRRLLQAYRQGIFPWYSDGQPVLWWSPDPRTVLLPDRLHVSRSLAKSVRNRGYRVAMDRAFPEVVAACAAPRAGQDGTWITREMRDAYTELHLCGYAHSVEVRHQGTLVGGLYGVAMGGMFFGESMFSRCTDASKVALVYLCAQLSRWRFLAVDCQTRTDHLLRLGANPIPRRAFTTLLGDALGRPHRGGHWTLDPKLDEASE
jgi:leucyl/phenylalanyl-tRNA--protein transferase